MDWYKITEETIRSFGLQFIMISVKIVLVLIFFLIGWFISLGIGKLIAEILRRLQFNYIFEKGNWKEIFEKADLKIDAAEFIGDIIKWILVIVFLTISVGLLGLTDFSDILKKVVNYLPNVFIAVCLFVATVLIADILEKVVVVSVAGSKFPYSEAAGTIVKWAIWIFAFFAILERLIPEPNLFQFLFSSFIQGITYMIVIAVGLAFGLGGKDIAADILKDIRKKIKE